MRIVDLYDRQILQVEAGKDYLLSESAPFDFGSEAVKVTLCNASSKPAFIGLGSMSADESVVPLGALVPGVPFEIEVGKRIWNLLVVSASGDGSIGITFYS